jgi:hypothetical protein
MRKPKTLGEVLAIVGDRPLDHCFINGERIRAVIYNEQKGFLGFDNVGSASLELREDEQIIY